MMVNPTPNQLNSFSFLLAIGEAVLNLGSFYKKMYEKKSASESFPKSWIKMKHPNESDTQGELELEIELLTAEEAFKRPAGFGRGGMFFPSFFPF